MGIKKSKFCLAVFSGAGPELVQFERTGNTVNVRNHINNIFRIISSPVTLQTDSIYKLRKFQSSNPPIFRSGGQDQ